MKPHQPHILLYTKPKEDDKAESLADTLTGHAQSLWAMSREEPSPRPWVIASTTEATLLFIGDAFREIRNRLTSSWEQDYPEPGRWDRARQRRVETAFRKIERGLAEAELGMHQLAIELMTQDCEPPTKQQTRRRAR